MTIKIFTSIIVLVFLLSSCSSKPAKFYILNPMFQTSAMKRKTQIAVNPINLADYLDKAQIITRLSPQHLALAEHHRWAEPLRDNIRNVIINNLRALLHTPYVFAYPSYLGNKAKVRITIDIQRFDTNWRGDSVLNASWQLINAQTGKIIKAKSVHLRSHTRLTKPINYNAIVTTMNLNLQKLSYSIARSI